MTREGGAPALLPLGASCINQAVKGIAIARGRVIFSLPPKRAARLPVGFGRSGAPLGQGGQGGRGCSTLSPVYCARYLNEEGLDLTCQPEFRDSQK